MLEYDEKNWVWHLLLRNLPEFYEIWKLNVVIFYKYRADGIMMLGE